MSAIYFITMIWALILIAFGSAFIILLMGKLGIREAVVVRSPRLISELFSCDFCLSFWTGLILAIILAIFSNEIGAMLIPFLSTPITRVLI